MIGNNVTLIQKQKPSIISLIEGFLIKKLKNYLYKTSFTVAITLSALGKYASIKVGA